MNIETRALFVFVTVGLVIGVASGFVASTLLGSHVSVLRCLVPGLIGAFVGGGLFKVLDIDVGVKNVLFLEIVTAAVGALIVLIPAQFIA